MLSAITGGVAGFSSCAIAMMILPQGDAAQTLWGWIGLPFHWPLAYLTAGDGDPQIMLQSEFGIVIWLVAPFVTGTLLGALIGGLSGAGFRARLRQQHCKKPAIVTF